MSTRSPGVQAALEGLYAERVGADQLAALQEGFRKANPGQLEQGAAGRMMSRLSGLIPQNQGRALVRQEKPLSEQEVTDLKGADFHAVLFERLILAAPEKVNSDGREVPLKLVLGAAAKAVVPAAASD